MRIGIYLSTRDPAPLDGLLARIRRAESAGFHSVWLSQTWDWDPLGVICAAGRETRRIELGTWVVPLPPRHPAALAQAALTAQVACGGRLLLAVGMGHAAVIERRFGLSFAGPARQAEERLAVLRPLLAGAPADHAGESLRAHVTLSIPDASEPPLLLAALGPRMLDLAGRAADGAAIWIGGPRYLGEFALPRLRRAAAEAGRPPPRIACGLPIVLTRDRAAGRAAARALIGRSASLPSYRAVLEREGATAPEDVAMVGEETELRAALARLADLGVTDFNAVVVPVREDPDAARRTFDWLASWTPPVPS